MIERWFSAVLAAQSYEVAKAIADCGGMVKGYGATRHRTTSRLLVILDAVRRMDGVEADFIRQAFKTAMSGEDSAEFDEVIRNTPTITEPVMQRSSN